MSDRILFFLGLILTTISIGFAVFQKEQTLQKGKRILLRLAPKDPRSLMQGDYMALRYTIETQLNSDKNRPRQGHILVYVDHKHIAHWENKRKKKPKKKMQWHLQYKKRKGRFQIGPNAFFFQEGMAKHYEKARYGEFRVDKQGHAVLIALADDQGKRIIPSAN